jgi:hypothetical protein
VRVRYRRNRSRSSLLIDAALIALATLVFGFTLFEATHWKLS